jgi:hypothetical protein
VTVARFGMLAALALLSAGLATPARAAIPDFASYFAGTWTCTSDAGAHIVKTYGASENGTAFALFNSYVTASGNAAAIIEHFSQHGSTVTVVSQPVGSSAVFVGTGTGFTGDRLAITGMLTTSNVILYQHETYTRTDAAHFTRAFESARSPDGPYLPVSSEQCSRVAAAPVPTPAH